MGGLVWRRSRTPGNLAPDLPRTQARFDPLDPQDLVDLAFGCPFCGGQAGIPRLRGELWGYSADAHCRCTTCEKEWILELDPAQIRRVFP
jgi:hypothetical protein